MIEQHGFVFPGAFESIPVLGTELSMTRSKYGRRLGMAMISEL